MVEVEGWVGCWMGAARCSIGLGSLHRQRECRRHTLCGDALERQPYMSLRNEFGVSGCLRDAAHDVHAYQGTPVTLFYVLMCYPLTRALCQC